MDCSSVVPVKRKADEDAIRCICGLDYDDGFSIACDNCSRWCHAACFGIVDADVPEEWKCWICQPRLVDKDAAERLQRSRINRLRDVDKQRRRLSPGVERKHRRPSTISEPQKRRRPPSITTPTQDDDLHIDIDEPSTHAYVPITADIVHPDAREKLRRHAHNWRGVSAISNDDHPATPIYLSDSSLTPTTTLKQIPSIVLAHPFSNPDVRPPAYAVHTAAPVPSHHFIAPYTSSITPSSSYLADPLNAYAHLGMPKPFVHLIGPPLDLALDARIAGDSARFVRSGCKPNAVLRPVLCPSKDNSNTSTDSLSFGVFALRDLKPNEEVVLGWEWDDGNAVHSLPALVQAPHTFNHPSPSDSPHQIQRLRHQMSNILHALSSTFTTCACGAKARDCVINQMSAFVDGHSLYSPDHLDLGPLVGKRRGFRTREKLPFSSGMGGVEMCSDEEEAYRDRKGKGKAQPNSLLHDDDDNRLVFARSTLLPTSGISIAPPRMQRTVSHSSSDNNNSPLPEPDPPDQQRHSSPPLTEDRMPPKMRKRWNRQLRLQKKEEPSQSPAASIISLGSTESGDHNDAALGIRMDEDNLHHVMPPPPLPSTSSDLPNLHSFGRTATVMSLAVDLPHPSLISSPTTDLTQSPFQSWAPFERKEVPTEDANKKMDVVESAPIQFDASSPSPHSPPASLSPRSRSRTHSRSPPPHSSPTSTAITTPPSPREPKLPDVPPPIRESPESPPPHIDIDAPSPRMPPIVVDDDDDDDDDIMIMEDMHPRAPSPPRVQSTPIPDPMTPASPQQPQSSPLSSPPPAVPSDVDHDEPTPRKPTTILSRPPTPPPQQTTPAPEDLTPTATPTLTQELTSTTAPALPPASPSPSPPSPPPQPSKVKLSLKDFAARKKRLREETGAGSSSVNTSADASPMVGGMKSLQASPKPPSDQLPPWATPTPAAAASAAWESTDNMSPNLPWWIRTPLLSVVGTDPPPKDIGISAQTTTKVPDGSWAPFRKIDPQLGQPRPMSKEEPVLNSLGPSTPIPVSTSLPIKLRSEMRPTLGSTRSAKEQDILLKKKEQELVAIQNRNRAREFDQLVRRDREMREEREKQLKSDAVVRSALIVNGTTPEPPPQEDGEIMAQTHTPVPSTPLQPPASSFTSSTPVSSSTVTPSPLITPSLAPVSASIPAPVSIPTAPRAHRKFTGSYSNTPTGPRFFRSIELPKGPPPPKGPSALRDSMNITRRPVPSQIECSHPYPPPPNTSPPPQPPPPPRTSLPSPTPTPLPSVQLSIPFSQSWDTSLSMSQKLTPQAPRAFSRSFTNGNSNTGNNSRVSSPSSRASPTPSNGSTTPSPNPLYSLSQPLPPISTKSHTLSRTTSTPTTPTASSTPTTTTLLNPSVAGLPSRPPAPVGLGLGHHLSSSHPMSMLGTSMAMGGVAKRSGTEKPRFTRRTSEDRERDRDRDRDRDLSRDRDWDRDRFDRDRDRDRDNRERERGGDRERDREREYRDRVWPRHTSSPSSHQEWDSWDR